jgi:hypothetical protein
VTEAPRAVHRPASPTPHGTGRDLPFTDVETGASTAATVARFFVTAPMLRVRDERESAPHVDGGPFHAKEMGTPVTACGINAESWAKAWSIPFGPGLTPVCLECAAVTRYVEGHRGHD